MRRLFSVLVFLVSFVFLTGCSNDEEISGYANITGTPVVGSTLRANFNVSGGRGTINIKWLKSGNVVVKENGDSYVPTTQDVGSTIKVVVTLSSNSGSITSNSTETIRSTGSSSINLILNNPVTVNISSGSRVQVSFTASSAGTYRFQSSSNTLDPTAYTSSSGTSILDDDSGTGINYMFDRSLTSGQTFTYWSGVYNNSGTGSYTITVQRL